MEPSRNNQSEATGPALEMSIAEKSTPLEKSQNIAATNQKNSPLLRLAPELRNQIYEYVLGGETYIVRSVRGAKPYFQNAGSNTFALLRTCRQVHAEAALLPYSLNTFSFRTVASNKVFCKYCTPAQLQAVKALQLYTWEAKSISVYGGFTITTNFGFIGCFVGLMRIDVIDAERFNCSGKERERGFVVLAETLRSWVPGVTVTVRREEDGLKAAVKY